MKRFVSLGKVGIVMFLLVACNPSAATLPQSTETTQPKPPATATVLQVSPEPAAFTLSEKGPYHVGTRTFSFNDANRDGRYVSITVWYPAVQPGDSTSKGPSFDADPDFSSAPYPLILSDTKNAKLFAPYLVSHGFAWASVDGIDTWGPQMDVGMIDQPLDILFMLDRVASSPPEGLEGMINAEQVGVIGYSFSGYNTLALSGARIDPEYYLAQCPNPDATTEAILSALSAFDCPPSGPWDEFAAHAGDAITTSEDGMWQPMTDERIRAVIPMAGEGWWLFGERGLAAVDRPVLIIAGTQDKLYPENALIYEHLGTHDKAMISFVGDGHMVMVSDYDHIARLAHFATAFFGYHLQGREDYAEYFSEDFVAQCDDLFYGVYDK